MPYMRNRTPVKRARRAVNGSYLRSSDYRGPGAIAAYDMGLGALTVPAGGKVKPTATTPGVKHTGITQTVGHVLPHDAAVIAAAAASAAGTPTAVVAQPGTPMPPGCNPSGGWSYDGTKCVQTFFPSSCPTGYTLQGKPGLPGASCMPTPATVQGAGVNLSAADACAASGGTYANSVCTPYVPPAKPAVPTCQVGWIVDPTTNQCVAVACATGMVMDAATGKCIPVQPTPDIACATAGGTWDSINNICVKQTSGSTSSGGGGGGGGSPQAVNCVTGYLWDAASGQCLPASSVVPGEACLPGQAIDPVTGYCIDGSVPGPAPVAATGFSLSSIPWWAWAAAAAGAYFMFKKPASAGGGL